MFTPSKRQRTLALSLSVFTLVSSIPVTVQAMGKPQGGSCTNPDTKLTTPSPMRRVVLGDVGTLPFKLPNKDGSQVDLQADLNGILQTAVGLTQVYFPTDAAGAADPCGTHLEIAAAVTTLSLNAFQAGISFGYTPSGSNNPVTGLTGKVDVKVGSIQMDFAVRECVAGSCTTKGVAKASHLTAGVATSLTVDFGDGSTTPNFSYDSPLGQILRGIMNDGLKSLVKATNSSLLSWSATVRDVTPGAGIFVFDAGQQSLIKANQAFAVYAVTPSHGACATFQAVAYAHTSRVDPISSVAEIDQTFDSRGVKEGDKVVIRQVQASGTN